MLITNLTILAVELKKLIGSDCKAEMDTEYAFTILKYGHTSGEFRIGAIITNDVCQVEISAGYDIRLENVVECAAKLRADDVIHVYRDYGRVHKKYSITLERFSSFSVEQIEHAAKDIAGTMEGL